MHRTTIRAVQLRPAALAPTHSQRSPFVTRRGPIHPQASPTSHIPHDRPAIQSAANEEARAITLQISFACATLDQSQQFSIPAAFPLPRMLSTSPQRHKPPNGTKSLKIRKTQIRFSAVQGLLFGSSSSVMLRLIGHGIVSEKNFAVGMAGAGISFHRRKETC